MYKINSAGCPNGKKTKEFKTFNSRKIAKELTDKLGTSYHNLI